MRDDPPIPMKERFFIVFFTLFGLVGFEWAVSLSQVAVAGLTSPSPETSANPVRQPSKETFEEPNQESNPDSSQVRPSKKLKGRVLREKEAEGTQAPNRFDPDIVFKSQYELDGKPLEVDTD